MLMGHTCLSMQHSSHKPLIHVRVCRCMLCRTPLRSEVPDVGLFCQHLKASQNFAPCLQRKPVCLFSFLLCFWTNCCLNFFYCRKFTANNNVFIQLCVVFNWCFAFFLKNNLPGLSFWLLVWQTDIFKSELSVCVCVWEYVSVCVCVCVCVCKRMRERERERERESLTLLTDGDEPVNLVGLRNVQLSSFHHLHKLGTLVEGAAQTSLPRRRVVLFPVRQLPFKLRPGLRRSEVTKVNVHLFALNLSF